MRNRHLNIFLLLSGMIMLNACSNTLDITQVFPFTVETMPVPKEVRQGETVEIRCTLKAEGDFSGTAYTVRYFPVRRRWHFEAGQERRTICTE